MYVVENIFTAAVVEVVHVLPDIDLVGVTEAPVLIQRDCGL